MKRAEEWKWSSVHEYAGASGEEQGRRCELRIDGVHLPAGGNTGRPLETAEFVAAMEKAARQRLTPRLR